LKRFWRKKNANDQKKKSKTRRSTTGNPVCADDLCNSVIRGRVQCSPTKQKQQPRWTLLDKRCSTLADKVGMMPVWDEWGVRHPVYRLVPR
jgi:hypothetical protein